MTLDVTLHMESLRRARFHGFRCALDADPFEASLSSLQCVEVAGFVLFVMLHGSGCGGLNGCYFQCDVRILHVSNFNVVVGFHQHVPHIVGEVHVVIVGVSEFTEWSVQVGRVWEGL